MTKEFDNSETGKAMKVRDALLRVADSFKDEGQPTNADTIRKIVQDDFSIETFARLHDIIIHSMKDN